MLTSTSNPRIKNLRRLDKAAERREQGMFLVEGVREVFLASTSGYELVECFVCEALLKQDPAYDISQLPWWSSIQPISEAVYRAVAYRESTEGILATFRMKAHRLDDLKLFSSPLILVIEGVEKPGNLGAMLRTCDAVGVDAVVLCDTGTDVYNANVIRSSIGTVFTNQIAVAGKEELIAFVRQNNIALLAAELSGSVDYATVNMMEAVAVAVGTEATGLTPTMIEAASQRIKIPMLGKIDSLNVSVSAAVLLFEARRQRNQAV